MTSESTNMDSKYRQVRSYGEILLEDSEIDFVLNTFSAGVLDAAKYLGRNDIDGIVTIGGPKIKRIGYLPEVDKVALPVSLLQNLGKEKVNVANSDVRAISMRSGVNEFIVRSKLPIFLKSAGREEGVHLFGARGDKQLIHIEKDIDKKYWDLPMLWQFLVDFETQAREITDEIAISKGEPPFWKECNDFMKTNHPDLYRLSAAELIAKFESNDFRRKK